jgi:hypothetical protein
MAAMRDAQGPSHLWIMEQQWQGGAIEGNTAKQKAVKREERHWDIWKSQVNTPGSSNGVHRGGSNNALFYLFLLSINL